jgi:hypothetical protein
MQTRNSVKVRPKPGRRITSFFRTVWNVLNWDIGSVVRAHRDNLCLKDELAALNRCINAPAVGISKESADSIDMAISNALKTSNGSSVMAMNVWTESEAKCEGHCYHNVGTGGSHLRELNVSSSQTHIDLVCCRCTHGFCSTMSKEYFDILRQGSGFSVAKKNELPRWK